MKVTPAYSRAWFEWRRTEMPEDDRTRAYLDLDHLRSDLSGLGAFVENGRAVDYGALAANELALLHQIEIAVETEVSATNRAVYRTYIQATRRLLGELASLGTN